MGVRRWFLWGMVVALVGGAPGLRASDTTAVRLTGHLRTDLVGLTSLDATPSFILQDAFPAATVSRKSPWIAAGLSLLIPGAGEFYAESYWKAAAFLALDVVAWVLAYTNDKQGNEQSERFQAFANTHWSVVRYAQFAEKLAPPGKVYQWRVPGTEGMSPADRPWTQVNWAEINRMERDIAGYYSHTLPPWGDQQYYELIGKYPQFNQGWDDAPAAFTYGDPLTPRFLYYSLERGKANDLYATATTWVTIAIVNHVLSALDAAWSASLFNGHLQAHMEMQRVPVLPSVSAVPAIRFTYGL